MKCMVTIRFHQQDRAAIDALIPQEQAHIRTLMEQGTVQALYVSADRSQVWVIMQGESQAQVEQELEAFPLYAYMQTELALLLG